MRGMKKWLIGTSICALTGALSVGCTVGDDESGSNLGGSSHTGGEGGGDATTGGTPSTGGEGGSVNTQTGGQGGEVANGGGGAETGGGEGGVPATGGVEAGGAPTGGTVTAGGAGGEPPVATGGATAGGAGGAGGAVFTCYGSEDLGALPSAYTDCSEWSSAVLGTQSCRGGGPEENGPLADDLCWYYIDTARADAFDALLDCFGEFVGDDCDNPAHDDHMWACVSEVGSMTCETTDGAALCETVTSDCGDVTTEFCLGEVNLLVETERGAVADCWAGLRNGERTGANCADNFDTCF